MDAKWLYCANTLPSYDFKKSSVGENMHRKHGSHHKSWWNKMWFDWAQFNSLLLGITGSQEHSTIYLVYKQSVSPR